MAVNTVGRPDLPDLVIYDIFRRLRTKAAARFSLLSKKWEGILACLPILDFDEGGDQNGDNNSERHKKFVDNILIKYLELYEREKQKQLLDKFRLHMTSYLYKEANLVNNLLSLSFKRSVKEVDISLRVSNLDWNRGWPKRYYLLSRTTFLDAKSITTLTLEHVRIKNIDSKVVMPESTSTALLPSLKTVALKNVYFDRKALVSLIGDCPSIENLSLISCSFACSEICFSSSSLKMFEAKYCKASEIVVYKAVNLESVTIVSWSSNSLIERVILKKCCNLRYMDIHGSHMTLFHLEDEVKGTIRAPNLDYFSFEGYLNSNVLWKLQD